MSVALLTAESRSRREEESKDAQSPVRVRTDRICRALDSRGMTRDVVADALIGCSRGQRREREHVDLDSLRSRAVRDSLVSAKRPFLPRSSPYNGGKSSLELPIDSATAALLFRLVLSELALRLHQSCTARHAAASPASFGCIFRPRLAPPSRRRLVCAAAFPLAQPFAHHPSTS